MVPLHDGAPGVGLAPLDEAARLRVDLEAELVGGPGLLLLHAAHPHVLQRDDPLGDVLGRVLEVVQAPVRQHEPPALPRLPAAAGKKTFVKCALFARRYTF